jgi:hypothetical protein
MADNDWKLEGTYFETCNCNVACPCVFLSPPTEEDCTVLISWHIDKGHFNNVDLNGLNMAMAVHSPGHMMEVKWDAVVYVDDRASEEQKNALLTIFSGQAGGHPARLASHVGNMLGVKSVALDYQAEGRKRSIKIGDVAEAEIEGISGQGGEEVTVTNHALCIAPGYPAVAAKSKHASVNDEGLALNISDKNGFYSPFTYSAS